MAGALKYDKIIKYQVTATCLEPLHIGNAVGTREEVLVHPIDEVPFIQATSIAGVFRDYFTHARGAQEAGRLFGSDKFSAGREKSAAGEDYDGQAAETGTGDAEKVKAAGVGTGSAETTGIDTGSAETTGIGTGSAETRGSDTGNAETTGSGTGNAETTGIGMGSAETTGSGTGNAGTIGTDTGNAETAETGMGSAKTTGTGTGKEGSSGSRVRFTEGTFLTQGQGIRMELRPRLAINRATGTCDESNVMGTDRRSGHKFNMEYVGAGAGFRFCVYLYDAGYQQDIEDIFAALNSENLQFGGQKSNGCGYVKIDRLQRAVFDMKAADGRRKWFMEEELAAEDYEDITEKLPQKSSYRKAYEITVTGRTEGELLVKGIAVMDNEEKDQGAEKGNSKKTSIAVNIRNAKEEFIIPGSSLKGAVRSQMEKIAAYLNCEKVIYDTFGSRSEGGTEGSTGNISFFDTVVGTAADNERAVVRYRIHIDKFTGGVMDSALFAEKNVSGELKLHIVISDKNSPEKSCGLLLLALRDLAIGTMSLGSGYNIGKGIMEVDTISVTEKDGRKAVIDYKRKRTEDESGLISGLLGSLRG